MCENSFKLTSDCKSSSPLSQFIRVFLCKIERQVTKATSDSINLTIKKGKQFTDPLPQKLPFSNINIKCYKMCHTNGSVSPQSVNIFPESTTPVYSHYVLIRGRNRNSQLTCYLEGLFGAQQVSQTYKNMTCLQAFSTRVHVIIRIPVMNK